MTRRLSIPQLFLAAFLVPIAALAHPGAGIVVDPGGQENFTDTGYGVWKIAKDGRLSKFHDNAYHWMAIDLDGVFSTSLTRLTDGSFIRLTPDGAKPALISSGGLPIATSRGRLYYGRFTKEHNLEIIARAPNGTTSILATIRSDAEGEPLQWLNGIAAGFDGSIYFTENSAVRRIALDGTVSTVASRIHVPNCQPNPLPGTPAGAYLRGLAVDVAGQIYVAANGCRCVLKIGPSGEVRSILTAEPPWSPTGVAVFQGGIYILEYDHTPVPGREWPPRVRKIDPDGSVTVLATVPRTRPR
jgi:hypothetical protein